MWHTRVTVDHEIMSMKRAISPENIQFLNFWGPRFFQSTVRFERPLRFETEFFCSTSNARGERNCPITVYLWFATHLVSTKYSVTFGRSWVSSIHIKASNSGNLDKDCE